MVRIAKTETENIAEESSLQVGGAGIVLPAKALNADEVVVNDVPLTELAYGLGLADLAFGYKIAESVRAS